VQRSLRPILIVVVITCVAPALCADDRMTDLAARLAEPTSSQAQSEPLNETETESAQADAPIKPQPIENRPLGAKPDASSQIVTRDGTFDTGGSWIMSTLTSLGLVLGLTLIAKWAYTKFGGHVPTKSSPIVEVLSRSSVAPRNHVLLLRVGSRILVVSDSPGGVRTLANIDDAEEVASLIGAVSATRDNSITRSFTRLLQGYNKEYDADRIAAEEGGDDGEFATDRARDSVSGLMSRVRQLGGKRGGE